jgi:hypothetical protein
MKTSTDRQNNTNKNMKRETKQHQYRHQQIDKTTPMKTSTDRQNNTNKNINI